MASKNKTDAPAKTKQAKLLSMHMAYPLSKMKLYKKNPRNHEDTIDLLVRSLGIFGAIAPIVLRHNGTIAAGHARYKAAKKQGRKTFPAIKVKFADEEAFIAYVMADNQIATRSTWISAEFGELHDLLDAAGWVPEDTGFDPDMIPAIRAADLGLGSTSTKDPDKIPEPPKKAKSRLGDLYILGNHRVLCGDATKQEDIERLLDGAVPVLMVTDPPYGVNYDPGWRNDAAAKGQIGFAARREGKVTNDNRIDWGDAYELFPGDVAYTWSPSRNDYSIVTGQVLQRSGFIIRMQMIWAKPAPVIGRGHYNWQHEPCWYAVRKGKTAHWIGGHSQSTLWQISNRLTDDEGKTDHGTQKPVECMARPIRNHKAPEVYDPFLGSGTTLIACEQLGRKCYGMEIEPLYVQVCIERWEQFTGKDAILESTGKTFTQVKSSRRRANV